MCIIDSNVYLTTMFITPPTYCTFILQNRTAQSVRNEFIFVLEFMMYNTQYGPKYFDSDVNVR